jgi:hypothetical protein
MHRTFSGLFFAGTLTSLGQAGAPRAKYGCPQWDQAECHGTIRADGRSSPANSLAGYAYWGLFVDLNSTELSLATLCASACLQGQTIPATTVCYFENDMGTDQSCVWTLHDDNSGELLCNVTLGGIEVNMTLTCSGR